MDVVWGELVRRHLVERFLKAGHRQQGPHLQTRNESESACETVQS
jgi:hypothetical protein